MPAHEGAYALPIDFRLTITADAESIARRDGPV